MLNQDQFEINEARRFLMNIGIFFRENGMNQFKVIGHVTFRTGQNQSVASG